ncbi:HEAT repeat domain-containing protein [Streptomyces sp. SCA3-4]|uniref:SMI1/KNR4 family protein n=1 Tax=Streptomyces sichuanensis TaxID=2871810 RepID=UPI001CE3740A|nr:SMI1/KNR4 family protein [Streptomyces sichuanensis]MCA6091029.1 HEAT repeat domain-containing protein [Streptomyces sichuanensis]
MDARLARIAAKLAKGPRRPDRGSPTVEDTAWPPSFAPRPPLALAEVEAFEERHQVSLPGPYRRFITEIGDGGPGPSQGLLPLSEWDLGILEVEPDILQRPSSMGPDREYGRNWWSEYCDNDEDLDRGVITVVSRGGADYTFLIISGPARGRLAYVNTDGHVPPYVTEDADFLSWYERWLDEMAAGYTLTCFGENIPGNQEDLLSLLGSDQPAARRARAAWSLMSLPRFDPEGTPALLTSLRSDPSPAVRSRIWQTAGALGLEVVLPLGADALLDTDPDVRGAALCALDQLSPPDLVGLVRPLLNDLDSEVRWAAYRIVVRSGALRIGDLRTSLGSDDARVRRDAAYRLKHLGDPGRGELLRAALTDQDAEVRRYAVQSVRALEAVSLLPVLKRMLRTEVDKWVLANLRCTVPELEAAEG